MKVSLNINNKDYTVEVAEDEKLLWVIRDKIKLSGLRYSCTKGLCGACTVLINDIETKSCITTAISVSGAKIETIPEPE